MAHKTKSNWIWIYSDVYNMILFWFWSLLKVYIICWPLCGMVVTGRNMNDMYKDIDDIIKHLGHTLWGIEFGIVWFTYWACRKEILMERNTKRWIVFVAVINNIILSNNKNLKRFQRDKYPLCKQFFELSWDKIIEWYISLIYTSA